jgi:hypothetical protein
MWPRWAGGGVSVAIEKEFAGSTPSGGSLTIPRAQKRKRYFWQGREIFMGCNKEVFDAELYAIWIGDGPHGQMGSPQPDFRRSRRPGSAQEDMER